MALTMKQLLDFSWMSQASYLDFSDARDFFSQLTNSPNTNPDKILADIQAQNFTGSSTADPTDGYSWRVCRITGGSFRTLWMVVLPHRMQAPSVVRIQLL